MGYDLYCQSKIVTLNKDVDSRRPGPSDLVLADISWGVGRLLSTSKGG